MNDDDEDETLARAIGDVSAAMSLVGRRGARHRVRRAALRVATVTREEQLILDVPLDFAAEQIHAVLPAIRHPLLSSQSATDVGQYRIRWIAGAGIGKLNPVLVTVSLTDEAYGTVIKVRGAAKEHQSAHMIVDELTGILADLFGKWDVLDIID